MVRALFMILASIMKTLRYSKGWLMAALMILSLIWTARRITVQLFQEKCLDPDIQGCHIVKVVIQILEFSTANEAIRRTCLEGTHIQCCAQAYWSLKACGFNQTNFFQTLTPKAKTDFTKLLFRPLHHTKRHGNFLVYRNCNHGSLRVYEYTCPLRVDSLVNFFQQTLDKLYKL